MTACEAGIFYEGRSKKLGITWEMFFCAPYLTSPKKIDKIIIKDERKVVERKDPKLMFFHSFLSSLALTFIYCYADTDIGILCSKQRNHKRLFVLV